MTRLQSEWQRLYLPHPSDNAHLIDAAGRVRAMVLTLARPADWGVLSPVWQAVQADLALPAPAIAVSGTEAYQLWFSLAEPVPAPQAHAFLDALRARYLADVAPGRIGLLPAVDAQVPQQVQHVKLLPGQQALPEQWSAFVAPDLAPMFAQTPWLDLPPSPEGQADLLSHLQRISPAAWHAAWARLQPEQTPALAATKGPYLDPQRFLRDVMNDEAVALALRIEAAKALLPYARPSD